MRIRCVPYSEVAVEKPGDEVDSCKWPADETYYS